MSLWGWLFVGGAEPVVTAQPISGAQPAPTAIAPQLCSLNLLEEFRELIKDIGSWVLIRKWDGRSRCSCWRRDNKPDPSCILCDGKGHPWFEYPVRAAGISTAVYTNLAAAEVVGRLGTFSEEGKIFLVAPEARIGLDDMIFEVSLVPETQAVELPINRLSRFDVSQVAHLRDDRKGDVAYLVVYSVIHESKT